MISYFLSFPDPENYLDNVTLAQHTSGTVNEIINVGNSCGCISTDSLKDVISPDNITYPVAILGMHVLELLEKLYQTNGQIGLMTRYSNENCMK